MIWDIIELIVFILGLTFLVALSVGNVYLVGQNNNLKASLTQEAIDRIILMNKIKELVALEDEASVEKTDGFLKFVSDSRDAAFVYIEDVQAAIAEFHHTMSPTVEHYKKTGKSIERKPSELVREITEAYDKLMESMPNIDKV